MKEINSQDDFEKAVAGKAALIEFRAPWCAPCHLQAPISHRVARRFEGKVAFGSINIETLRGLAQKIGIHSVPAIIIYRNGSEVMRVTGLQSEDALSELLSGLLA